VNADVEEVVNQLLRIKAVPGASRDEIAGMLGERLKVRISAPAEGGKANKAICTLIAKRLGLRESQVTIESGHSNAEKVVRIEGVSKEAVAQLIED
jgi:uncharacterized protein (TIGR00251 family)